MTKSTQDTATTDTNEQAAINEELQQAQIEKEQAGQNEEDIQRDAQAAQMAAELGLDDAELEPDFDPSQVAPMTPEQEAQALKHTQDMLQTSEGAEMAAIGAIDWYEELLQEHGHEKYAISDKKKARGTKRLTPVIQKYAPEILGLFGQYKSEVMAALFVGSLTYGSVKQIKALKAEDLAEDKRLHPEKYETKEPATDTAEKAA